jgi:hypothetical protein
MARDGAGTYNRTNGDNTGSQTWTQDKADGDKIVASRHDAHDQDIADALTASLAKDGQTVPTANLPMGGFKHTGVADASARTDYAKVSQVQNNSYNSVDSGGSSNAYTLDLLPDLTAYTQYQRFVFGPNFTNNGDATLNINGLGPKAIQKFNGTAYIELAAGDIINGSMCDVIYTGGVFHLQNPATLYKQSSILATGFYLMPGGAVSGATMTAEYYSGSLGINKFYVPKACIVTHLSLTLQAAPGVSVQLPLHLGRTAHLPHRLSRYKTPQLLWAPRAASPRKLSQQGMLLIS